MRSLRCNKGLMAMHTVSFRASACQVAGRLQHGQARVLEVGERQPRPLERSVPDSLSMRSHSARPNGKGGAAENNGSVHRRPGKSLLLACP
jgi:ketosteroid isomerase-like protein